eukprot:TRINITY_DN3613_c0_g1_i1.p1 TRINITY_DN3613_c0_g1~~TRINITY_DN3613_c0_g1_i1.p1  ORF type:complete len:382 (+),score=97.92 TRINITY_DN3613_c0_g1_i1:40-1185(+)
MEGSLDQNLQKDDGSSEVKSQDAKTPSQERNKKILKIPSAMEMNQPKSNDVNIGNLFKPKGNLSNFLEQQKKKTEELSPQRPPNHANANNSPAVTNNQLERSNSSTYFATSSTVAPPIINNNNKPMTAPILVSQATPEMAKRSSSLNKIVVNPCQKENRMLKFIKNVGYEFGKVIPDYVMGHNTCAFYLSLKYHLLHPQYIYTRIAELKSDYRCRILLVIVDIENPTKALQELARIALATEYTLILAWDNEEAARYIETYKKFENKGPDIIKERPKEDFSGLITDTLTTIRGVNKTDVQSLMENFGTFKSIINASMEELSLCPGIGEKKVKRMYNTFHQPFKTESTKKKQTKFVANEEKALSITFDTKRKKKPEKEEEEDE